MKLVRGLNRLGSLRSARDQRKELRHQGRARDTCEILEQEVIAKELLTGVFCRLPISKRDVFPTVRLERKAAVVRQQFDFSQAATRPAKILRKHFTISEVDSRVKQIIKNLA